MPGWDKRPVPEKVHRREITARVKRRRTCNDERPYFPVTWTLPSDVVGVGDFGPLWVADRDYWIAGVMASMDSNAAGSDVELNVIRIAFSGGLHEQIVTSDSRINIPVGLNIDAATSGDDASLDEPDFDILGLIRGDQVYPTITQFGTGDRMEITLQLVPVRQIALEWLGT